MSYDLHLKDLKTGSVMQLSEMHDMKGGTYCLGGSFDASLNVTYNYSKHYYRVFAEFGDRGLRTLYGMTGAESLPVLAKAISLLGNEVSSDYWEPTEGNAKRALINLMTLAAWCLDGVWEGD